MPRPNGSKNKTISKKELMKQLENKNTDNKNTSIDNIVDDIKDKNTASSPVKSKYNMENMLEDISDNKNTDDKNTENKNMDDKNTNINIPSIPSIPSSAPDINIKHMRFRDDYENLYSDKPTKPLGNKRFLLQKIKEYKELFPTELKDFKINQNASEEELEKYIEEADYIVSSKSIGSFLDTMILSIIEQVEEISYSVDSVKLPFVKSSVKCNIRGTSELLKKNKEFYTLTKKLYIKHKVFTDIPDEWKLVLIVTTTAIYARQKNINQETTNSFLNEEIDEDIIIEA